MSGDLYDKTRAEILEIDNLIIELGLKRKILSKELKKFRLPHYCPFCTSDDIVKSPVNYWRKPEHLVQGAHSTTLTGFYYCKSCGKGSKIQMASPRKLAALKEAIETKGENVNG